MLIQYLADIRLMLRRGRSSCGFCGGNERGRRLGHYRSRGKLVELLERLVVCKALALKLQPVFVKRRDTMRAAEYLVNAVFFKSHKRKLGICKRRFILKHTARKKVVYIRNHKRTPDGRKHIFLEFRKDFVRHRFVLGYIVAGYSHILPVNLKAQRERKVEGVVVNKSVSVCLEYFSHCNSSKAEKSSYFIVTYFFLFSNSISVFIF